LNLIRVFTDAQTGATKPKVAGPCDSESAKVVPDPVNVS